MTKAGKRLIAAAQGASEYVSRMTEAELKELMAKALARYEAMTPEQKAAHDKAQRESFVRAMKPTGDPRFD